MAEGSVQQAPNPPKKDNLRVMYDNLVKEYDLPDYETFKADMADPVKREKAYASLSKEYDLPDFETFSSDMGFVKKKDDTQPLSATSSSGSEDVSVHSENGSIPTAVVGDVNDPNTPITPSDKQYALKQDVIKSSGDIGGVKVDTEGLDKSIAAKKSWDQMSPEEKLRHNADVNKMWFDRTGDPNYLYKAADIYGKLGDTANEVGYRDLADTKGKERLQQVGGGSNQADLQTYHNPTAPSQVNQTQDQLENVLSGGLSNMVNTVGDQIGAGVKRLHEVWTDPNASNTEKAIGTLKGVSDLLMGAASATPEGALTMEAFNKVAEHSETAKDLMGAVGDMLGYYVTKWNGGEKPKWADDAASLANLAALIGVGLVGKKGIGEIKDIQDIRKSLDAMTPEKQQEIFGKVDQLYKEYEGRPQEYKDAVKFNIEQNTTVERVPHPDEGVVEEPISEHPVQEDIITEQQLKSQEDANTEQTAVGVLSSEPPRTPSQVAEGSTSDVPQPPTEAAPTEGQGEAHPQDGGTRTPSQEDVMPSDDELSSVASKVQAKQPLTDHETSLFNDHLDAIANIIKSKGETPNETVQKALSTREVARRRSAPAVSLRAWLLQKISGKKKLSLSAENVKRLTGFDAKEFPKGVVKDDGITMDRLYELLQDEMKAGNTGFTFNGDSADFAKEIGSILPEYFKEADMVKDLDALQLGGDWRYMGFNSLEDYQRDIAMREDMAKEEVQQIEQQQQEYINNLTDDQINAMYDDWYKNDPRNVTEPTTTDSTTEAGTTQAPLNSEGDQGGMGGEAPPTEPPTAEEPVSTPSAQEAMGIAHAEINRQRMAKGLEELHSKGVGTDDENLQRAITRLSTMNDTDMDAQLSEWSKPGTVLNTQETFMLGLMNRMVENDINAEVERNRSAQEDTGLGGLNDQGSSNIKLAILEDRQKQIQDVAYRAGTEQGGSFRARQSLFTPEYSLARMMNDYSRATGIKEADIPPQVQEEIKSLHKQLDDLRKASEAEMDAERKGWQEKLAEANLKLLQEKIKGERSGTRRAKTEVNKAQRALGLESEKAASDARKEAIKAKAREFLKQSRGQAHDLGGALKTSVEFAAIVKDLAEENVKIAMAKGAVKLADIMDAVYDDLADFHDVLTKRDIQDIFSGYGKVKKPSEDELKRQLSQLKSEARYKSGTEDVKGGSLPKRSGYQRPKESGEIRAARQEMEQAMKEANISFDTRSREERMASALDRYKATLENRIKDLDRAIQSEQKIQKTRQTIELDDRARELLATKEAMQDLYNQMFGEERKALTDEQRIKIANKAIDELQAKLDANDIGKRVRQERTTTNPKLQEAWDKLQSLRDELKARREAAGEKRSPEAIRLSNAIKAQERALVELDRRISEKDITDKKKNPPLSDPALDALKEQRKQRKAEFEAMRNELDPDYNNRKANEFKQNWYANRIKSLQEKIDNKDFAEPQPKMKEESTPTMKARIEYQRKIGEYNAKKAAWRKAAQYGKLHKWAAALASWGRFSKLAYVATYPKLIGAAVSRMIGDPLERTTVGRLTDKLLGKKFLEQTSGAEGATNLGQEIKFITDTWDFNSDHGILKQIKNKVLKGATDQEVLYGEAHKSGINMDVFDEMKAGFKKDGLSGKDAATKAMEFAASLEQMAASAHAIIKTPIQQQAWNRSFALRLAKAAKEGKEDVNDPMVQFKYKVLSLADGNRAIFMQDNALAKWYSKLVGDFERSGTDRGAVGSVVAKIEFPIVKVPSNFLSEASSYVLGGPIGLIRAFIWKAKGFENMPPEVADSIQRQLRKGITGGLIAWYFMNHPEQSGGFYQRGEHRKAGDLQAGEDKYLPKNMTHDMFHVAGKYWSSVGRMMKGMNMSNGKKMGMVEAMIMSFVSMFEEHPFANTTTRLIQAGESGHGLSDYLGETAKGIAIPGLIQEAAALKDNLSNNQGFSTTNDMHRQPDGIVDQMKMGIPFARETVGLRGGERLNLSDDVVKILDAKGAMEKLKTAFPTVVYYKGEPIQLSEKDVEELSKVRDEGLKKRIYKYKKNWSTLKDKYVQSRMTEYSNIETHNALKQKFGHYVSLTPPK